MKKLYVLSFLFLAACAQEDTTMIVAQPCIVEPTESGSKIICPDGSSAEVRNGTNGQNGADGQNGTNGQNGADGKDAILAIIQPCGTEFANDEILLQTAQGIVALYDGGANLDRLVLLADGHYITSDRSGAQKCHFDIINGSIANEEVR